MLHLLGDTPASVVSDLGETLAQNRTASLLFGDQTGLRGDRRYHAFRWFTEAEARLVHPPEEHEHHARAIVADLRATAARRHGDADVNHLVDRLQAASDEFSRLWDEHAVGVRRADRKTVVHPQVGPILLDCETLVTPDQGQLLLVLTPADAEAAERLALLSVVGLQEFPASAV
jgi:hypothetical protein